MDQHTVATKATIRAAAVLVMLTISLGFIAAAIAAATLPIKAGVGADCGSLFSGDKSTSSFDLTDVGHDTCVRERADRQALAISLALVGAGCIVGAMLSRSIVSAGAEEAETTESGPAHP